MAGRKLQINGDGTMTLPSACVDAESLTNVAGRELPVAGLRHLHVKGTTFGLSTTGTPVTATWDVHTAQGPGSVTAFFARLKTDGSSTGITVDLKKNGTSILSAPVALTDATGDGVEVTGTITTPNYVAGDEFTIVMTVTTSTGAQGPYAQGVWNELAA